MNYSEYMNICIWWGTKKALIRTEFKFPAVGDPARDVAFGWRQLIRGRPRFTLSIFQCRHRYGTPNSQTACFDTRCVLSSCFLRLFRPCHIGKLWFCRQRRSPHNDRCSHALFRLNGTWHPFFGVISDTISFSYCYTAFGHGPLHSEPAHWNTSCSATIRWQGPWPPTLRFL